MSRSIHLDLTSITDLLGHWLSRHVAKQGLTWLGEKREQISGGAPERVFFTAFSAVPRYTGKKDLELRREDLQAAEAIRTGLSPGHWSVDQVARTLLLLALPQDNAEKYLRTLFASLHHRRRGRVGRAPSKLATITLSGAALCPSCRGGSQQYDNGLQRGGIAEPLSRRLFRQHRLEPDGTEGNFCG